MRLGLTLTQHLLLRLPFAWRGHRLGPAPACLTLTHLSVCLSVSQSAGPRGLVLSEAQPLPFSQVTHLGLGDVPYHIKDMGEGAVEKERQAESRGGQFPLRGWAADCTTMDCGWRGRRTLGATPRGTGNGLEPGQRDSLTVVPG